MKSPILSVNTLLIIGGITMGKVIKFPSKEVQGMAFLEDGIRKIMAAKGESEEAISLTLDTLKEVYSKYADMGKQNFSVKLPPYLSEEHIEIISNQITEGVQMLNKEHAKIINKLASELVLTKVELLKCKEALKYET